MWGFVLLGSTQCDRGSLVMRWEVPGGIGSSSGAWPTSFNTLLVLVGYFDL